MKKLLLIDLTDVFYLNKGFSLIYFKDPFDNTDFEHKILATKEFTGFITTNSQFMWINSKRGVWCLNILQFYSTDESPNAKYTFL